MTAITSIFGGGVNGLVTCSYTYDDVSALITTLSGTNDDSIPHTVSLEVDNPATLAVMFSHTVTLAAHTTTNYDVSGFNVLMVDRISKSGSHYLGFPYILSSGIS